MKYSQTSVAKADISTQCGEELQWEHKLGLSRSMFLHGGLTSEDANKVTIH